MNLSSVKNDWAITCNRYVGYIDIMGFKDLVLKHTHAEIYKMMKKIEDCQNLNENVQWGKIEKKLVATTNYSDSIMIYSKDNSFDSLKAFSCTISGIIDDLLSEKIPFKGAIAFGTMTLDIDKSIFFGQPLIDSYLLQEELYFYGVVVHATAEKEILKNKSNTEKLFFTNYLCPLKTGSSYHWTIHPLTADHTCNDKEFIAEYKKLKSSVNKLRFRTSGHLRKYIDNTEQYLEFVWENSTIKK